MESVASRDAHSRLHYLHGHLRADHFPDRSAHHFEGSVHPAHLAPRRRRPDRQILHLALPFGTDNNGRDAFARVLEGARISLLVGVCGAFISLVVGTTYGLISGYAGGRTDAAMMRFVEILYSIPRLIILILFTFIFDKHFKTWLTGHGYVEFVGYSKIIILIVTLGLIEWLTMARIVRGQVLALEEPAIRHRRAQPRAKPHEDHLPPSSAEPRRHRHHLPHPDHPRRHPRRKFP